MALPEKPELRPIEAVSATHEGRPIVLLRDPTGYSDHVVAITEAGLVIAALFDGTRTARDVQAELVRRTGELVMFEKIEELLAKLDAALLLEGESFENHRQATDGTFAASPSRAAVHAGQAYEGDPEALAAQLDFILTGAPPAAQGERLAGLVAPHIDLRRGKNGYRAAYGALREAVGADGAAPDLYVVFGTRHAPAEGLFNLTAKDYDTPLGPCRAARGVVERVAVRARDGGDDPFTGEAAHRTEHSIEFQCVFLRHLHGDRAFEIVPILCGSMHEDVERCRDPGEDPKVARFVDAVREEAERGGRRTVYVAAADLSHVGPHFGGADPVTEAELASLAGRDRRTLEAVAGGDARSFFSDVSADGDRRNICGIPPIWATLAALGGRARGKVLHYGQAREPEFASVVTYGSAALYVAP